jgi:uncharacterized membrane protein
VTLTILQGESQVCEQKNKEAQAVSWSSPCGVTISSCDHGCEALYDQICGDGQVDFGIRDVEMLGDDGERWVVDTCGEGRKESGQ